MSKERLSKLQRIILWTAVDTQKYFKEELHRTDLPDLDCLCAWIKVNKRRIYGNFDSARRTHIRQSIDGLIEKQLLIRTEWGTYKINGQGMERLNEK